METFDDTTYINIIIQDSNIPKHYIKWVKDSYIELIIIFFTIKIVFRDALSSALATAYGK